MKNKSIIKLVSLLLIFTFSSQVCFARKSGGGKMAKFDWKDFGEQTAISLGCMAVGSVVTGAVGGAWGTVGNTMPVSTGMYNGIANSFSSSALGYMASGINSMAVGTQVGSAMTAYAQLNNWGQVPTYRATGLAAGIVTGAMNPGLAMGTSGDITKGLWGVVRGAAAGAGSSFAKSETIIAIDGDRIDKGRSIHPGTQILGFTAGLAGGGLVRQISDPDNWRKVMGVFKDNKDNFAIKEAGYQIEMEDGGMSVETRAEAESIADNLCGEFETVKIEPYGGYPEDSDWGMSAKTQLEADNIAVEMKAKGYDTKITSAGGGYRVDGYSPVRADIVSISTGKTVFSNINNPGNVYDYIRDNAYTNIETNQGHSEQQFNNMYKDSPENSFKFRDSRNINNPADRSYPFVSVVREDGEVMLRSVSWNEAESYVVDNSDYKMVSLGGNDFVVLNNKGGWEGFGASRIPSNVWEPAVLNTLSAWPEIASFAINTYLIDEYVGDRESQQYLAPLIRNIAGGITRPTFQAAQAAFGLDPKLYAYLGTSLPTRTAAYNRSKNYLRTEKYKDRVIPINEKIKDVSDFRYSITIKEKGEVIDTYQGHDGKGVRSATGVKNYLEENYDILVDSLDNNANEFKYIIEAKLSGEKVPGLRREIVVVKNSDPYFLSVTDDKSLIDYDSFATRGQAEEYLAENKDWIEFASSGKPQVSYILPGALSNAIGELQKLEAQEADIFTSSAMQIAQESNLPNFKHNPVYSRAQYEQEHKAHLKEQDAVTKDLATRSKPDKIIKKPDISKASTLALNRNLAFTRMGKQVEAQIKAMPDGEAISFGDRWNAFTKNALDGALYGAFEGAVGGGINALFDKHFQDYKKDPVPLLIASYASMLGTSMVRGAAFYYGHTNEYNLMPKWDLIEPEQSSMPSKGSFAEQKIAQNYYRKSLELDTENKRWRNFQNVTGLKPYKNETFKAWDKEKGDWVVKPKNMITLRYSKEKPSFGQAMAVSIQQANNKFTTGALSFGYPMVRPEQVSVSNFNNYIDTVKSFSIGNLSNYKNGRPTTNPAAYMLTQRVTNSAISAATNNVETTLTNTPYVRDAIGWAFNVQPQFISRTNAPKTPVVARTVSYESATLATKGGFFAPVDYTYGIRANRGNKNLIESLKFTEPTGQDDSDDFTKDFDVEPIASK